MALVHLTLTTVGRRPLAKDEGTRRRLVRGLVRARGSGLLIFSVVDDHLHAVEETARPQHAARDLARAVRAALPGVELAPVHVTPVESRAHLERLVGYLLRQPTKHGLDVHPALWTGSCFPDLAGIRLLDGYDSRLLLAELPRLKLRDLLPYVGLPSRPIEPADDAALRRLGPAGIASLAADLLALPEGYVGRDATTARARRIAVSAATCVGFRSTDMADPIRLSPRGARKASLDPPDPTDLVALRRRLTATGGSHA